MRYVHNTTPLIYSMLSSGHRKQYFKFSSLSFWPAHRPTTTVSHFLNTGEAQHWCFVLQLAGLLEKARTVSVTLREKRERVWSFSKLGHQLLLNRKWVLNLLRTRTAGVSPSCACSPLSDALWCDGCCSSDMALRRVCV